MSQSFDRMRIQHLIRIDDTDSDSNHGSENDAHIEMNLCPESESEESERSYDYLSDGEDELLELRKRRLENKNTRDTVEDEAIETEPERSTPPKRVFDINHNDTVLEHEAYMEALI